MKTNDSTISVPQPVPGDMTSSRTSGIDSNESHGPTSEFGVLVEALSIPPQLMLAALPRSSATAAWLVLNRRFNRVHGFGLVGLSVVGLAIGFLAYVVLVALITAVLVAWAHTYPGLLRTLADRGWIAADSGWLRVIPGSGWMHLAAAQLFAYVVGSFIRLDPDQYAVGLSALRGSLKLRDSLMKKTMLLFLLGLGMLPLSALILFVPIVMPEEAVLSDTTTRIRNRLDRLFRKVRAFFTGTALLLGLLAFATVVVEVLGLNSPIFESLFRKVFGTVADRLPPSITGGWPFVLLVMYATDFVLLFFLGRVPLRYNLRNLRVRWVTNVMTGVSFTVVIFILVLMISFVDSVNRLTQQTGVPGNVFVLSEGAPDEVFSNLGYGTIQNLELEKATFDPLGRPLTRPITSMSFPGESDGRPRRMVSKETYFVINQEIAQPGSGPSKRRFAQLRGIDDAEIAGKIHDVTLLEGKWFGREGSMELPNGTRAVPCVLGQGAAVAWGNDYGKDRLRTGETFRLGNLTMVVVGVMKSAGKTFDSETWATNERVSKEFGKQSFTTVIIRVSEDDPLKMERAAEIMAWHLSKNFSNPAVRAVSETRYYQDLAKSNNELMYMVIVVAVIISIGGVIGVMLVMFAAIAQRTKDIGVMRVLGYKRWQILVSFMLESLSIALIGGILGVFLVLAVNAVATAFGDGLSITSNVSSGQGGSKSVVTKLAFGTDVLVSGILFTIVMGRAGGLLPSVGAMRAGILDSLK